MRDIGSGRCPYRHLCCDGCPYPNFSWTNNVLSDLGVGATASTFNSALMAGGALALVFSVGLFLANKGALWKVGVVLLLIDAVMLFGIGLFPETMAVHLYVSVAFFGIFPLAAIALGVGAIRNKSRNFGLFTILLGIVSILPWPIMMAITATSEAASAAPILMWWVIQGAMLLVVPPSEKLRGRKTK
ncbi:MAG: DUF998 domain-containing protein [Candidatus Hadarchaeota archaeon]